MTFDRYYFQIGPVRRAASLPGFRLRPIIAASAAVTEQLKQKVKRLRKKKNSQGSSSIILLIVRLWRRHAAPCPLTVRKLENNRLSCRQ